MQNFIGPLATGLTEHAETHATGGTDPLTPEAIGAASEFYAENLAQDAVNLALQNTQGAIASHLAATNPHGITPSVIGAAVTTHTHTGSQITGNISGNAANVTGVVAIANGGTGANTAASALTNLGAAAATHTHAVSFDQVTFNTGWELISRNEWETWRIQVLGKLIILTGQVRRSSVTTSNIMFTLPVHCRPSSNIVFAVSGLINNATQFCRIDINSANGNVSVAHPNISSGTINSITLNGIIFVIP